MTLFDLLLMPPHTRIINIPAAIETGAAV